MALLAVIRAIVDQADQPTPPPPDGPPDGSAAANGADEPATASRYQPITVTVEE